MGIKTIAVITLFLMMFSEASGQKIDTIYSIAAFELLKTGTPDMIIIDGRDSLMHASGHIRGSFFLDAYSDDHHKLLENYTGYPNIFIYCTTHRRSDKLIAELLEMGYNGRIVYMRDGIRGWKKNGFPLEFNSID